MTETIIVSIALIIWTAIMLAILVGAWQRTANP
jgi:hypothetical protein